MKTCDWHPSKGVVASASKDNVIKLWDPRGSKDALATLQGHNATIMQARPLLVPQARTNLLSIGISAVLQLHEQHCLGRLWREFASI